MNGTGRGKSEVFMALANNIQYILYIHLTQMIDKAKSHLDAVAKERKLYREVCKASRKELKSAFTINDSFQPPAPNLAIPPRSTPAKIYVTGFRKTDHIVTIDIARNTDLKY